jgi:S1-C subfamily serine protease
MRLLIAMFSVVLALTQFGSAQIVPNGPSQGIPTLAPLVKKVTPSVVNIAIKGRIAQE